MLGVFDLMHPVVGWRLGRVSARRADGDVSVGSADDLDEIC